MPQRLYHARREPPSLLDHVLAHPLEVPLAVFQLTVGSLGVLAALSEQVSISPTIDTLPWFLGVAMCALLVVGGGLTLGGVFNDDDDNLMVGWGMERLGLVLAGTGWVVYAGVVLATHPESVPAWAFGLVLTAGYALRVWATFREERRLRAAIQ